MTNGCPLPRFSFLDVELDTVSGRLVRRGEEQHLRQKALEVLLYLIGNRDRTVAKEEILDHVWNAAAVSEDTLVQCIVDIRRALGDEAKEPRFVRTVLKRGYQFIAPVQPAPVMARSVTVEVETSSSVEIELVEADDAARTTNALPWRAVAVALLAVGVLALAGLTYSTLRAREQVPRAGLTRAAPVDSLTSSSEALRLYALGIQRAEAFRSREAVELLEKAIALDPKFAMAHARIGWVRGVLGTDIALARPHIERALELVQRLNEKERMLVSAWQTIVNADFATAIERYRLIVDRYPTDIEAHRQLARLLSGEEQLEEAIEVLERAQAIDPRDHNVQNALGLYSFVGRHEEAIAAVRRYVEHDRSEPNAWDSLGLSNHWAGRYEEALEAYRRALELRPDFHLALYHRAATYVQLGRFQDAIRDIQDCLNDARTEQEIGRAWGTLGDVYRLARDPARAQDAVARIPAASSWQPTLSHLEGASSWDVDPRKRAESLLARSGRGSRPERRFEFVFRGSIALRSGDADQALEHLRRAMRFRPSIWYVDSFETVLADAYLELGRFDDAAREYERILAINDRYSFALYGLGRACEGGGKRAEARDAYRRFLTAWKDADPDAHDLIAARRRLERL